ncbi:MAG: hypothetical protein K5865_05640 [Eubacterium sp.]|nr:hypothetical protein [Eubacterium sp.]
MKRRKAKRSISFMIAFAMLMGMLMINTTKVYADNPSAGTDYTYEYNVTFDYGGADKIGGAYVLGTVSAVKGKVSTYTESGTDYEQAMRVSKTGWNCIHFKFINSTDRDRTIKGNVDYGNSYTDSGFEAAAKADGGLDGQIVPAGQTLEMDVVFKWGGASKASIYPMAEGTSRWYTTWCQLNFQPEAKTVVRAKAEIVSDSTVYLGEVKKDGANDLKYIYSSDVGHSKTIYNELSDRLPADYASLIPSEVSENEKGMSVSTKAQDKMSSSWVKASAAAISLYQGTVAEESSKELAAIDAEYKKKIQEDRKEMSAERTLPENAFKTESDFLVVVGTSVSASYEVIDGVLTRVDTITFKMERVNVIFTSANIKSEAKNPDNKSGGNDKKADNKKKYSNEWVDGKWYDEFGNCAYEGILSWKSNATGWWVEDTAGWYPTSSWQKIDGVWYYFKPDGYMAANEYYNGYWFNANGSWDDQYFLSWKSDATGWWVEDISGWWPSSSWLKIDGYWYYFDASGYMVTSQYIDGWWISADGICY